MTLPAMTLRILKLKITDGLLIAFIVASLVFGPASLTAQTGKPAKKPVAIGAFRIAGTIVNANTSQPLARAQVSVTNTKDSKDTQTLVSGDDGRFHFWVGAGKYSLRGAKRGFLSAAYEQHENFWTGIVTGGGLDTENLVLRLPPASTITGTVTDDAGEPVRDAKISLLREDHTTGVSRIQLQFAATTDDLGTYEITPLVAGTYFLSVHARPWYTVHPVTSAPLAATYQVDRTLDAAFPISYYKDATEPSDATPIPIQPGDHALVDIHLNAVPALHVVYRAAADSPNGANQPHLAKRTFDGAVEAVESTAEQISPGVFEVTGIPPGSYLAQSHTSAGGEMKEPAEVLLNTDGQDLDASGGEAISTVKASVQIRGSASLPEGITVILRDSKSRVESRVQVDEHGDAQFGGVAPGDYEVTAVAPTKLYSVLRMTREGKAVPGHQLNVPEGTALKVSIVLAGGAVTVEGLAQQDGKPVHNTMVVLVPSDPEANIDLFRRDQSDLDGSFEFQQVIPGAYTVLAIEDGWDLDWAKPAVIESYRRRGRRIVIGDDSKGSVHLPGPVEIQPKL